MQRIAHKSYTDQLRILRSLGISDDKADADLRDVAKLGSWGKYIGNIHPERMEWLGSPIVPAPFLHRLPVKRVKADGTLTSSITELEFPIFLPHVLFAWYYKYDKQRFKELFLGDTDAQQRKALWCELKKNGKTRASLIIPCAKLQIGRSWL